MENQQKITSVKLSKARLISGISVIVVGQLTTLLIPLVTASGLSPTWKATLSGILFFVTPQLGIFVAIAIFGKSGYDYLKGVVFSWLKMHVVPDHVGPVRYFIGLIMFIHMIPTEIEPIMTSTPGIQIPMIGYIIPVMFIPMIPMGI